MTHTPSTFAPLADGWTLTAVNIEAAPESLREALAAGIPATVPGEATLDLLNAGLIADPFDGANENDQQWIGDVDWRFTCRFDRRSSLILRTLNTNKLYHLDKFINTMPLR